MKCDLLVVSAAQLITAPEGTEPMDLPVSDSDRGLIAAILMKHDEELTAEKTSTLVSFPSCPTNSCMQRM